MPRIHQLKCSVQESSNTSLQSHLIRHCEEHSDSIRHCEEHSDSIRHCEEHGDSIRHCEEHGDSIRHCRVSNTSLRGAWRFNTSLRGAQRRGNLFSGTNSCQISSRKRSLQVKSASICVKIQYLPGKVKSRYKLGLQCLRRYLVK